MFYIGKRFKDNTQGSIWEQESKEMQLKHWENIQFEMCIPDIIMACVICEHEGKFRKRTSRVSSGPALKEGKIWRMMGCNHNNLGAHQVSGLCVNKVFKYYRYYISFND